MSASGETFTGTGETFTGSDETFMGTGETFTRFPTDVVKLSREQMKTFMST
jgi:hypothetical protein